MSRHPVSCANVSLGLSLTWLKRTSVKKESSTIVRGAGSSKIYRPSQASTKHDTKSKASERKTSRTVSRSKRSLQTSKSSSTARSSNSVILGSNGSHTRSLEHINQVVANTTLASKGKVSIPSTARGSSSASMHSSQQNLLLQTLQKQQQQQLQQQLYHQQQLQAQQRAQSHQILHAKLTGKPATIRSSKASASTV